MVRHTKLLLAAMQGKEAEASLLIADTIERAGAENQLNGVANAQRAAATEPCDTAWAQGILARCRAFLCSGGLPRAGRHFPGARPAMWTLHTSSPLLRPLGHQPARR